MKSYAWVCLLALPLAAQPPAGFVEVYTDHVKMGKRVDFDAINKKMAEMNRPKGDRWTAFDVVYGADNTVYFVSSRPTFAAALEGLGSFEGSIKKALGEAGMRKLFNDSGATVERGQEVLYRRRWGLSASAPIDLAATNKIVGQARWVRIATVHTRPGKILEYEEQLREHKAANERMNPGVPFWVSQSVAGSAPGIFRTTTLLKSLADLDAIKSTQEVRGSSYAQYQKVVAESVERVDIEISRVLPELSNPPDEIVAVDPAFWRPAPVSTSKAGTKQ
jgi:hypothetical protein